MPRCKPKIEYRQDQHPYENRKGRSNDNDESLSSRSDTEIMTRPGREHNGSEWHSIVMEIVTTQDSEETQIRIMREYLIRDQILDPYLNGAIFAPFLKCYWLQ